MTGSIKGPDGPRGPLPPASGGGGTAKIDLAQGLDAILAGREGGRTGDLVARQGSGQEPPFDGGRTGQRQDRFRTFSADAGTRLSEAWSGFTAGQLGFAQMLDRVLVSPDAAPSGAAHPLAGVLRGSLAMERLLSGLGAADGSIGDPRSLDGEAARAVGDLATALLDRMLDAKPGGTLPDAVVDGLREEAGRILASGRADAGEAIRNLCRDVIMTGGMLPAVLEAGVRGGAPAGLSQAVMGLNWVVGDGDAGRISADLASELAPLKQDFGRRFDDLLTALGIPGLGT